MKYKIETERLILRNYRESDIDDYFDYVSNPDVSTRLWGEPYKDKTSALVRLKYETTKPLQFAITLKPNDKVIGSIELMGIKNAERYTGIKLSKDCQEIGYLLSPHYWGQGIMPEATRAIVKFAFETLNCSMIAIGHNKANLQSAKVQDKVGFKIINEISSTKPWIDGKIYPSVRRVMTKLEYNSNPELKNFKFNIKHN